MLADNALVVARVKASAEILKQLRQALVRGDRLRHFKQSGVLIVRKRSGRIRERSHAGEFSMFHWRTAPNAPGLQNPYQYSSPRVESSTPRVQHVLKSRSAEQFKSF
jgi:hypothetical protein